MKTRLVPVWRFRITWKDGLRKRSKRSAWMRYDAPQNVVDLCYYDACSWLRDDSSDVVVDIEKSQMLARCCMPGLLIDDIVAFAEDVCGASC